ncbi:threonine ammonia-lyase [Dendrosporobacter sp. 1207_IL3150]|uniref:threonine ammonia-lyase n=1 Tax=Dendrosporobacter sp. 1207_IL3150 TaxID=3084054 RepID=UPI002FD87F86
MNNLVNPNLKQQNFREAMQRISPFVHNTPLERNRTISEITGGQVYFKLENMQKTGSFKIRGAANKIFSLPKHEAVCGVISASAGNHAQGVAWAANACGVPSIVVMPIHAPKAKIKATENYGAQVVLHGQSYYEAYQYARFLQNERKMTFIHAFDDEAVIAGQGTVALEIMSSLHDVDTLIAPIGGGGLMAGLAACAKQYNPKIKVIGVQAAGAAAMFNSLEAGSINCLTEVKTIADGIAVKRPGDITFRYIQQYVDEVVLVKEEEIAEGILFMLERGKMITEGAGVSGVAALLANKIDVSGRKTAVVVSGGNIDPLTLSSIIANKYQQVS